MGLKVRGKRWRLKRGREEDREYGKWEQFNLRVSTSREVVKAFLQYFFQHELSVRKI